MRREFDWLFDIWDAAERITRYVDGMDAAAFQADTRTQDAVIRCLERISEGAGRLSFDLRTQVAHVPWDQVVGIRHILLHGYDKVSADVIWETAAHWIPKLTEALAPLLETMKLETMKDEASDLS